LQTFNCFFTNHQKKEKDPKSLNKEAAAPRWLTEGMVRRGTKWWEVPRKLVGCSKLREYEQHEQQRNGNTDIKQTLIHLQTVNYYYVPVFF